MLRACRLLPAHSRRHLSSARAGKHIMAASTGAAAGSPSDGEALTQLLRAGRKAALSGDGPVTVVMGNEAADLDSVVCAVAVATALQSGGAAACAFVAVPRNDLRLRPDVEWIFNTTGVHLDALVCADELDVVQLATSKRRQVDVALVDHNHLTRAQHDALAEHVVLVIDHHEGECPYRAAVRDIAQVGSCSALVTGYVQSHAPALLHNRALRTLLLAATLIDTGNLSGASSRCTDADRSAAAQLSAGMSALERSALLGTLYEKRMDQSGLCCSDLLRRDYKEWMLSGVHVGISSIGVSITDMLARDGTDSLQLALRSWAASRHVDLLVVMTGHSNGPEGYARDLGLWAATPVAKGMLSALVAELQAEKDLKLRPLEESSSWPQPGVAFAQLNLKATRKVVQPALAAAFERLARKAANDIS